MPAVKLHQGVVAAFLLGHTSKKIIERAFPNFWARECPCPRACHAAIVCRSPTQPAWRAPAIWLLLGAVRNEGCHLLFIRRALHGDAF
jgi:hypothetical protein